MRKINGKQIIEQDHIGEIGFGSVNAEIVSRACDRFFKSRNIRTLPFNELRKRLLTRARRERTKL